MILRAKIFLLWLLALAIPVQGVAATLQTCAAAMTQRSTSVQQDVHAVATVQGMQHDAQMHAMHSHAQQSEHGTSAAPTAHTPPGHDLPSHAEHKTASCSYCAACTTGAVLPLALNAPPTPDFPSREFIALPASGFVGYLPDNPDRPPALA